MRSCDLGLMNEGLLAVRVPALKMRAMRFVLVSSAAYTTVKQKPAPNLVNNKKRRLKNAQQHMI